jgi:hypothetical protein
MTDLAAGPTTFAPHLQELIDVAVLTLSGQDQSTKSILESVRELSSFISTNHCLSCRSSNWFIESFSVGPRLVQRGCGKYITLAAYSEGEEGIALHGVTRVSPVLFCLQFDPDGSGGAGEAPPVAMAAGGGEPYRPAQKDFQREAAR